MPLVSILITTFNREKYIHDAITSVLNSSFQDFEIIVVDDCSADNTVEIVKEFASKDNRIKFFVNAENIGDYANRLKAASYATGIYLKYLDADDLIYPHSLSIYVEGMNNNPDAAMGVSPTSDKIKGVFPLLLHSREAIRYHFLVGGILDGGPTCVIIRRDIFERTAGFKNERFIGDIDFWFRIAENFPVLVFQQSLVFYREHDQQEIVNPIAAISYNNFSRKLYIKISQGDLFTRNELKVVKSILFPGLLFRIIEKVERKLSKLKYYFA